MTMKRKRAVVMMAATLRTVLVAGAPQAAVAIDSKQERCLAKAARAVGHAIDPADYAIQLGTSRRDDFTATAEQDLICGFGDRDRVIPATPPLAAGDIFIGGPGHDFVKRLDGGIVIGGRGHDRVNRQISGTRLPDRWCWDRFGAHVVAHSFDGDQDPAGRACRCGSRTWLRSHGRSSLWGCGCSARRRRTRPVAGGDDLRPAMIRTGTLR